jgi:DNA-binding NarL/FixJ family response regulator
MDKQSALLEHESQPAADSGEIATAVSHDELPMSEGLRAPAAEKLLEDTLVFNTGNPVALTKREENILRLIVAGQTNKQIAQRLSRSERTIEYHRNRLMRKMAAHNAAELVRHALVTGII